MTFRLALLMSGYAAVALASTDKLAKNLEHVVPGTNVAVIASAWKQPGALSAGWGSVVVRTSASAAWGNSVAAASSAAWGSSAACGSHLGG